MKNGDKIIWIGNDPDYQPGHIGTVGDLGVTPPLFKVSWPDGTISIESMEDQGKSWEARPERITLESAAHGQYQCRPYDLDMIMTRYAGYTLPQLQREVEEDQGLEPGSYPLDTKIEAFMILAELHGYATN